MNTALRTHSCGELRAGNKNNTVTLCGWVASVRTLGKLTFLDVRDRYGFTQVVLDEKYEHMARTLRAESVVRATGIVLLRPAELVRKDIPTGEIEVKVQEFEILNASDPLPIDTSGQIQSNEDVRLKYRYLDLRRPLMQSHLQLRHHAAMETRAFLSSKNFLEIETPMLVKTTPGGARVFKTPSRVHPGKFFSLPESPQIYKQLLMVSGCDRYFQLARCMRDEDLRADRQPEFTQIDMEMSFIDEQDIQSIVEGLLAHLFKKVLGVTLKTPFPRLTFAETMGKYGSDKPDLRFGLELADVTSIAGKSEFGIFKTVIGKKGHVFCLRAPGCGTFSRSDIDALSDIAKSHKLPGLGWMKIENTTCTGPIAKFFPAALQAELIKHLNGHDGDLLLFAAEQFEKATSVLGHIRLHLGKKLNLIKEGEFNFLWVVEFPFYEWNEDSKMWQARHHIFTRVHDKDWDKLESDPGAVRGKLYDCVLNGVELGSGSIRIHRKDWQERVLKVIGLTYEDALKRFDFLLDAFRFGAPPHGGIALGFDRLVTLMGKGSDIREFIAFPRNKMTENPMDGSPQPWTPEWLDELQLAEKKK